MTTYQGIAAVTQTLSYLIGNAVRSVLPEAAVTLSPPEVQPAASRDVPRLNIYLVQVMPEPTMRAADLPTRAANGQLVTPPQVALRLRYLFSFFGPAPGAQIMLGAAEIALREHGVLDAALIVRALADHPELAGSGLEDQSPPVTVQPSTISLEELSRFWSGFSQASYTLSTVYEAAAVLLTSAQPGTGPGLPVLTVDLGLGFGLPAPELGEFAPVTFADGASVPVAGTGVKAGQFLQVGDAWVPIEETGPGALSARLPANVRAGVTLVRLGRAPAATESVATGIAGRPARQPVSPGPASTAVPITGSAPRALVVQPVLSDLRLIGGSGASGEIAVTVDPPPAAGQRVALTLVSLNAVGDSLPQIRIGPVVAGSDQSGPLPFALPAGAPPLAGPYLGLVEVDGVSSVPTLADGRFALPRVTL